MACLAIRSTEIFFEQFPVFLKFFEVGSKVFAIKHDDVEHGETETSEFGFAAAESSAGNISNARAFAIFQIGQIKFGAEKPFADGLFFEEFLKLNQCGQTDPD